MLSAGLLDAVFSPRRIALVGASEKPGRAGSVLMGNLETFPGEVVPVTPGAQTVFGRRAYGSLLDVPGEIDLAVVAVPAGAVTGVVRDAAARGVRVVAVVSGGFAETGPAGKARQDELLAVARSGGVRVVGPNCLGVQNCDLPMNASLSRGLPAGSGGITLVTQSGAYGMAIHTVALDEGAHFAKVLAAGNKADIGDAELLTLLGEDPASRTLCFFCESMPDGRAFAEAAAAITPRKPVVVARTGRSTAGSRAAFSHTAALADDERLWRAAFGAAGVVLARSGLEMMDVARALDSQPVPAGPRVGVVTNSGGTGVELADLLADEGLEVPELSPALQAELRRRLPAHASAANPVDMTTVWARYAELYPLLVDRLARSGEVDVVVPVLLQRAAADPAAVLALRDAVLRLRADGVPVPVYVCWVTARGERGHAVPLHEAGIPCFDWPERTARAAGHAVRYGTARNVTQPPLPAPPRPAGLAPLARGVLDSDQAAALLTEAGVLLAEHRICRTVDEAVTTAAGLGGPVVAKVVHADLAHKSDVGGVRTGLVGAAAVRTAAADLLALARGARVLVQRQLTGVELVVGGLRDPQLGAMVMAGLGGVHVEVLDDVAFAPAPLDLPAARRLLDSLHGAALLRGNRGRATVDVDAAARLLCAVGDLVASVPEIAELDLNPVLVSEIGAIAVDWRICTRFSPAQDEVRPAH
ncbi:MAG: hypothetical protein QOD68_2153 [Actinomycetota bacterium]|nr:hypothetical protein [Actinomycetota bacterium]